LKNVVAHVNEISNVGGRLAMIGLISNDQVITFYVFETENEMMIELTNNLHHTKVNNNVASTLPHIDTNLESPQQRQSNTTTTTTTDNNVENYENNDDNDDNQRTTTTTTTTRSTNNVGESEPNASMKTNGRLLLMRGPAGSGKTTLARQLV
jgi:flagellar biosynthesis GTPase FlhF